MPGILERLTAELILEFRVGVMTLVDSLPLTRHQNQHKMFRQEALREHESKYPEGR
jgi:hypothetical protein